MTAHIVFYDTMIKADELMTIMKHRYSSFVNHIFNPYFDPSVYKLSSRQLFRHVLSVKYYGPDDERNRDNAGYILNDLIPEHHIITPDGHERLITKDEWINVFPSTRIETSDDEDDEIIHDVEKKKPFSKRTIVDLKHNDPLIKISKDKLLDIMSHITPNHDSLLREVNCLMSAPMPKEYIVEILTDWYETTDHKTPDDITDLVNRYYNPEQSNRWFFTLLKRVPKDLADQYRRQFREHIHVSININDSDYCFQDVCCLRFGKNQFVMLINTYHGVIGWYEDYWYIKSKPNTELFIKCKTDDRFYKLMAKFKPFQSNHNITLSQIFSKFSNYFMYRGAEMLNHSEPNIINTFAGFKYQEVITDDFTILQDSHL